MLDGDILLGSGTSTPDVTIQRNTTNTVRVSNNIHADGTISADIVSATTSITAPSATIPLLSDGQGNKYVTSTTASTAPWTGSPRLPSDAPTRERSGAKCARS